MWLFNRASWSASARTAVLYLTIGALTVVWTGVWLIRLINDPPVSNDVYYWVAGFMLTGLAFIVIGLSVGLIGRYARYADARTKVITPPTEKTVTNGATSAQVTRPSGSTAAVVAPDSPVLVPAPKK